MADFGLPLGLAYRHNWDAVSQHDQYLNLLQKQATIDKENKARMLTDDIKFGTANNRWDHVQLKGYSEAKVKELGEFLARNPDYSQDPDKLLMVKKLKNELINNPILERAMRVDTHYANMNKYLSDPKNSHMRNDPAIQKALAEYENYSKTGSADGVGSNAKEFVFMAPEEGVDTEKIIQEFASKVDYDSTGGGSGLGGYTQFISDKNRLQTAKSVLNNSNYGRYLISDWNRLDQKEQTRYKNIDNYVMQRMNPYFKAKKIVNGVHFKPDISDVSAGDTSANNPWFKDVISDLLKNGKGKPDYKTSVNPGLMQEVISDHQGNVDMRDAEVKMPGTNNYVAVNMGQKKGLATGKIGMRVGPDKKAYMVSEVAMDFYPDEFEEKFGSDALDALGLNNLPFTKYDEYDDFKIRPEFGTLFEKIPGEDGKPKVRAYVDVPFRGGIYSVAAMYNRAIGGKSFTTSQDNSYNSTKFRDEAGNYWEKLPDGEYIPAQE